MFFLYVSQEPALDLSSTFCRCISYLLSSWAHPWCFWAPWNQTGKASSISGLKFSLSLASTCTQSRPAGSRLGKPHRDWVGCVIERGNAERKRRELEKLKAKDTGKINAAMQFFYCMHDLYLIYAWFIQIYTASLHRQFSGLQTNWAITVNLFAWKLLCCTHSEQISTPTCNSMLCLS